MKYYIDKIVNTTFDEAVTMVKNVLPNYGFGVVTEFDINEKFKEKLGMDFRKYKVLGACNPKYAYDALQVESLIGTMLPCNIVIQEHNSNEIQIAAIDPIASMQAVHNTELQKAAKEIKVHLEKLIESI